MFSEPELSVAALNYGHTIRSPYGFGMTRQFVVGVGAGAGAT